MPISIEAREKVERNFLSPMFVKLANLHYINEEYEECIEVCRTGLVLYPDYLTPKLILLKAYLKAEYLNEAENLFQEVKHKITNKSLLTKLRSINESLASVSNQEKLYFPPSQNIEGDFNEFLRNIDIQEKLFAEHSLNEFISSNEDELPISFDPDFSAFAEHFRNFHFAARTEKKLPAGNQGYDAPTVHTTDSDALLGKVKLITETLADIYADQGNYREAFEAYNILLRAGSTNYKRIEDKIIDLERKMQQNDSV